MLRRILILALATSLTACTAVKTHLAFWKHAKPTEVAAAPPAPPPIQPAPKPAEGLWAILDPGCPKPSLTNFRAWPKCASPFWISHGMAMIVRSRPGAARAPDQSYRAEYRLAAGDPVIAQVGSDKDGYLFLALTDVAKDDRGRMISATGAAFACPAPKSGLIALRPTGAGCETAEPETVRQAARATLADHAALTRVEWIAAGAPT